MGNKLSFVRPSAFSRLLRFRERKVTSLVVVNTERLSVVSDRTPMHLAAENGHANIIELLVDKFRASIYERTKDGSTLMHIASLNGHADCAMMLFKKGVYLHMPNKSGARSIHTAARYGHVGIINTLLQKGEKVDVTTNVSTGSAAFLCPYPCPRLRFNGRQGNGHQASNIRIFFRNI